MTHTREHLYPRAREAIQAAGLRATQGRVEVYAVFLLEDTPLAHRDACEKLPRMDRVTVFRNLCALVDAGLLVRLDLGDRIWRFTRIAAHESLPHEAQHPHFTCVRCGDVQCLDDVKVAANPAHQAMLDGAEVQIRGLCEECRQEDYAFAGS